MTWVIKSVGPHIRFGDMAVGQTWSIIGHADLHIGDTAWTPLIKRDAHSYSPLTLSPTPSIQSPVAENVFLRPDYKCQLVNVEYKEI
jgi:hypothetical protein